MYGANTIGKAQTPKTYCSECESVVRKLDLSYKDMRLTFLILFLISASILSGCLSNNFERRGMDNKLYEIPEECDFSQVFNNSGESTECTPKLTPEFFNPFQGILINAPRNIELDGSLDIDDFMVTPNGDREGPLKIMVAGLLKVLAGTLNLDSGLREIVMVVAVNQKTAETYSGNMRTIGFRPDDIEIPLPAGVNEEDIVKGDVWESFNIDLVENLRIPIATADYTVYAVLGDYKSNVREIKVRVKE